ncbi:MAG: SEC-C metal-binding domain-containing protein [Thiomonas sp.]|nr:SEC-C metal-binding domain-containing protein [Thiomonas sp.]
MAPTLVEVHAFWQMQRQPQPEGLVEDDFGFGRQRFPGVRTAPKVGRNESCPCGGSKKFKKCCGAAGDAAQPAATAPH